MSSQERINKCTCASFSFRSSDMDDIKVIDVSGLLLSAVADTER